MLFSLTLLTLLTSTTALPNPTFPNHAAPNKSPIKCPIIFDGRVLTNTTLATFDDPLLSRFNAKAVKGENQTWASIIQFPPHTPGSRFDAPSTISLLPSPGKDHHGKNNKPSKPKEKGLKYKPFEVTIDDKSLFRAGGNLQTGFRRAGLIFKDDVNAAGGDKADSGVTTFHWSVKQNPRHGLNLTHEYMTVWHERADYAGNQFTFSMGLLLPGDGGDGINTRKKRESFRVQDNKNKIIFETGIEWKEWTNWGVQLDYVKNTIKVFYSKGDAKLKAVTKALPNDNSGGGQMQLGMAKKPTETETVVFDGYHEHIKGKEGQIYGGVFVEDSTGGCVSV